jgi:hypothetical protein
MKSLFSSPTHKAFEAKLETTREVAIYSWITKQSITFTQGKKKCTLLSNNKKKTPTQKQIPSSYRPSAQWGNKTIHCWIN